MRHENQISKLVLEKRRGKFRIYWYMFDDLEMGTYLGEDFEGSESEPKIRPGDKYSLEDWEDWENWAATNEASKYSPLLDESGFYWNTGDAAKQALEAARRRLRTKPTE